MNLDSDSPYKDDLEAQKEEHRYFKSVLKTFSDYKWVLLLNMIINNKKQSYVIVG